MPGDSLILASASPRRRELLAQLVAEFEVRPSRLEEPSEKPAAVSARQWAEALAYFKARPVADIHPGRWVLGADTIVVCGTELLGKPADVADARRMLEMQATEASDVITGMCLVRANGGVCRVFGNASTRIWMHDDERAREMYLAAGDWAGKAGAYGIQDVGDKLVNRREGSFSNVVGLPIERLQRLLKQAEIT